MKRKTILLCEDDPDMAELLRCILVKEGHAVLQSTNCEDIWDLLKTSQPDLILMDLKVPYMGGAATTRLLKSADETRHLKIVLLSAYTGLSQIATDAGADGYLPKPFDIKKFRSVIS